MLLDLKNSMAESKFSLSSGADSTKSIPYALVANDVIAIAKGVEPQEKKNDGARSSGVAWGVGSF